MKKILILCRQDERPEYDTQKTMLASAASINTQAEYHGANLEDLLFVYDGETLTVTDTVSGADIKDFDAIFMIGWFRSKILEDVARAAVYYAHAHGVPFANSEAFYGRSFSKLSQLVLASVNGMRVTPFVFSMDIGVLREAIAKADLKTPFILKAVVASRGNDNYLIKEEAQLAVLEEDIEQPKYFVAQQFVPNDGDFRVLIMGGKVRRVIHRKAVSGSHVNNTSKGGAATLVDPDTLPREVIEECVNLARIMRREVTGIDMIMNRDTNDFYFLEANNMPQLATGSMIAEKMAALDEYLNELANGSAVRYMD